MISRSQKTRLAIFFIVGFSVLLIIVSLLVGSRITEKRDTYRIIYEDASVAGLQIGNAVLYRGVRIGRIDDIYISSDNISEIVVVISVKHGTPIKSDQEATTLMVGITGIKQIQLSGGTNSSPFLNPGDIIPTGRTLMENLSDKAEILTLKVEMVIDNLVEITNKENQTKLHDVLNNLDIILADSKQPVTQASIDLANVLDHLSSVLRKLDNVLDEESLTKLVANTEMISTKLAEINYKRIDNNINEALQKTTTMITRFDGLVQKNGPEINNAIEELRETVENLNELVRLLTDDPSLLIRSSRRAN